MPEEASTSILRTAGSLSLPTVNPTLAQLEAFCVDARLLGVEDNDLLLTTRQGFLGPIQSFYFSIPVILKSPDKE